MNAMNYGYDHLGMPRNSASELAFERNFASLYQANGAVSLLGQLPPKLQDILGGGLSRELPGLLGEATSEQLRDMLDGGASKQLREALRDTMPKQMLDSITGRVPESMRDTIGRGASSTLREILEATTVAGHARRLAEQYLTPDLSWKYEAKLRAELAGEDSALLASLRGYGAQSLLDENPWEKAKKNALDGLLPQTIGSHFEILEHEFRAVREANRLLKDYWPVIQELGYADESEGGGGEVVETAEQAMATIIQEQREIKATVQQMMAAIHKQQNPAVKAVLFFIALKLVELAVGALMGFYAPAVLGESPQAAKKSVQESTRAVVGAPEFLADYRYVSTKELLVRQNPNARSPVIARFPYGKLVKLVKKDDANDFALVVWSDKESGSEIQGWVFARYLGKFK